MWLTSDDYFLPPTTEEDGRTGMLSFARPRSSVCLCKITQKTRA